MIPDPVRPDDGNGSGFADLQAIGLGPLDTAAARPPGTDKTQLFQTTFEVIPRLRADFGPAAHLLIRKRTQENVAFDGLAADFGKCAFGLGQGIGDEALG